MEEVRRARPIAATSLLLAIINGILDFSKIESGKIGLERASFSIHAVVEEVVELLAQSASEKGAVIWTAAITRSGKV